MTDERCPHKACKGYIEDDIHLCSLCVGANKARTMAELEAHVVKRHGTGSGSVETAA